MLRFRNITYTDRIRRRIRLLYLLLISMAAYMVTLFDMAAFYSVFAILVLAVVLKAAAFYYYSHLNVHEP